MDQQTIDVVVQDLKNNLRITWSEEDANLKKIIERAETYLNDLCGTSLDFSKEAQPKTLLLERCRYVYNNAADEFEKNYHQELSRLILKVAVDKEIETYGTT
jgi:hypothetical protein